MKFRLTRTSDVFGSDDTEIELDTLSDLIDFVKIYGGRVVIETPDEFNELPLIEVYDTYRE